MRLILFDIDGTLLRCGKQAPLHFLAAVEQVFGTFHLPEDFSFAGKTDPMIAIELVRRNGLSDDEIHARIPEVRDAYVGRLDGGLDRSRVRLLPGVVDLLERLVERNDLAIGLLTGNWHGGARAKLACHDLERYFPFGAFGDDARDRRGLVPVALERARRLIGETVRPEETLVVGDTVLDVDCAHHAGARCMAVASGYTDAAELSAAGADWVYDDLAHASRDWPLFSA